jgi:uncharacterized integral membrane protein
MPNSVAFHPADAETRDPGPAGTSGSESTLPPPSASASAPLRSAPLGSIPSRLQGKLGRRPGRLIVGALVCVVAIIFAIQNIHAANLSFLGIHLVLPLAIALFLAAVAGSLLTIAAGPARAARARKFLRHSRPGQAGS